MIAQDPWLIQKDFEWLEPRVGRTRGLLEWPGDSVSLMKLGQLRRWVSWLSVGGGRGVKAR